MMWASWIRIMGLLLTVAVIWRLISWCFPRRCGVRAGSVWLFLGRVVFVLGALLVTSIVFLSLTYAPRHISLVISGEPGPEKAAVRPRTLSHPDGQVPIDKLWDQLNQPKIVISTELIEIVATEEKVPGGQPEVVTDQGSDATDREEGTETQETMAALVEASEAASRERPDWVVHPPKRVGNTYRCVVVSGPYRTVDECHHELEEKLRLVVYQRMAADGADDPVYQDFTLAACKTLGIGTDYIYREICRDEYVESLQASFGPMVQVHLKLEFDPSIEQHLRDVWRQHQARQRLGTVAFLASSGLLLLGLTYGLLKFDTWTQGLYSKRLLLGVPAAIITLILLWLV